MAKKIKRSKKPNVRGRFKQGYFTSGKKFSGDQPPVYQSSYELASFLYCEKMECVVSWMDEPDLNIRYVHNGKEHTYYIDLMVDILQDNGNTIRCIVEVKPFKETEYPVFKGNAKTYDYEMETFLRNESKWKSAHEYAKRNGWIFAIWTEKTLKQFM